VSRSMPETGPAAMRPSEPKHASEPKHSSGPKHSDGVVAVMSHHATFAMQMRRAGFDVREGRDVEELAGLARSVDVVVVDLVAVEGKRGLVARLSTSIDPGVPVVLISADEVDLALLGPARSVRVVVPPVRADDVVSCVRAVLAELAARRESPAPHPEVDGGDSTVTPIRGREGRRAERQAARVARTVASQGPSEPEMDAPVVDLTRLAPPAWPTWQDLAGKLSQAVNGIPALSAAAQALAQDVAGTSGADVVVLVRDDSGTWQVEGGVGLRPFEWGQTLDDTDWLVVTGRDRYPSLLVADTDAVRGDLVGAPLASRHQIVRTHGSLAPFMVCAGWGDNADGRTRVAMVVAAVRRHEAALTQSMELRRFVRTLVRQVDGIEAVLS
jgi:hypothetical protein